MKKFDRQKALAHGIIHDEDHERNCNRLRGLYGKVAAIQNDLIVRHCKGNTVLDVGAGYGNLTRQLREAGKKVISLEVDEEKIKRALDWFGTEIRFLNFYDWDGKKESVDTIVFREVLNHLDMDRAFEKAFSVSKCRCLVFQGTEILPLRMAKKLYGHEEYQQKQIADIAESLRKRGFSVRQILYSDTVAFPLSGGWWGHCWAPASGIFDSAILKADRIITKVIHLLNAEKYFCFRALIVADKPMSLT